MSAGSVRVGVVGAGVISSQYLGNLTGFQDLEVVGVADLDEARAAERAAEFGLPWSGSVDGLLAHDDVEIVVNLTIPAAHAEVAARALEAGKHVWNEKPFALERSSALELLTLAEARGLRAASAPDTFLGAGLQTAQRTVESGAIGRPLTALAVMQSAGPERWHPNPDFFYLPGGGPLLDFGPYYVTALVQLLGPVASVTAVDSTALDERVIAKGPRAGERVPVTTPTFHSALLRFESGASAQLVTSFQGWRTRAAMIEVSGVEGAIDVPNPNAFDGATALWRRGVAEPETIPETGSTLTRGTGVVELARAIRTGVPERASGALAYHVLDVLLSIVDAAETGDRVDVASTTASPLLLPAGWDPSAATL